MRWPSAARYRDTEDILLVGSDDTEGLIRRMIKGVAEIFSSNWIHIGMDEANRLGLGKYMRLHGYRERGKLMDEHLRLVKQLCREVGKKPIMWSDMFFRSVSASGGYYDVPENAAFSVAPDLLEDVGLVYWDYYHQDTSVYDKNFRLHKKLTDQIIFAGGGWTWSGLAPNYTKALDTMKAGVKSALQNGIKEAICTFWFDNGMETPAGAYLLPMTAFALLCRGSYTESEMDGILRKLSGCSMDEWMHLDLFDRTRYKDKSEGAPNNPSKWLFYQDPLTGLFDGQVRGKEIEAHYARVHRLFDKIAEECAGEERQISDQMFGRKVQNDRFSSYPARSGCGEGIFYHYPNLFAYYRQLAGVLEKKAEIGLHIREAYDDGRKEELGRLSGILKELAVMVWELKEMRKQIWFLECKPFGIESLDIRFAGVYTRLLSAADRLSDYAAGRIDRIEELEEPRIYFDSTQKESLVSVPYWEDIVSAGNICGI